ncbi:hypothetical protein SB775_29125, partial [Peribacillus sp. SIMBA_075]|uniref:hypothetical protein n=1 Tax=Peribacillus sp. SIMBA_075 TaxID=3085813 RepID=UPI00397D75F2
EIIKERKLDITNIVNVLIPTDYLNPYKEEHTKIMISFLYLDRYIDNEHTIYDKYINLMKHWCNAKRPNENQFIYEFINWLNHLIHFYESM